MTHKDSKKKKKGKKEKGKRGKKNKDLLLSCSPLATVDLNKIVNK
jgi:hypothetical protein